MLDDYVSRNSRHRAKREVEKSFFRLIQGRQAAGSDGARVSDNAQRGRWLQARLAEDLGSMSSAKIMGFSVHKSSSKVTIGDWNPTASLFSGPSAKMSRDSFLQAFGVPRPGGFFSWSGSVFPRINQFNDFGQMLRVDPKVGITVIYRASSDRRAIDIPWELIES